MLRTIKHGYYVAAYWMSWVLFASVGALLGLACLPLLLLPRRESRARRVRSVIQGLFRIYAGWFRATGVLHIAWEGFDRPLTAGVVYVANHPTLLDAPLLLSRLPDAICIFKPHLLRSPAIGPAAVIADYAAADGGVDMVRAAAERVAAGRSLLIFPEGTRTEPGSDLGPCRAGFALVANRARAPIQLIVIRATAGLVTRGRAWWRPPTVLPATLSFRLDRRWDDTAAMPAARLAEEVEEYLRREVGAADRVPQSVG